MLFKIIKLINIIVLLLIVSCKKQDVRNDDSRMGSKIMILGHAGMGQAFSWPQNSKESILTCLEIGCDGSEIDVQMTLDSVLVAYHDDLLNTQTNCFGKIDETTWHDIQSCKYNKTLNSSKLISLEDLFSSVKNIENYYFSIHCKVNSQMEPVYLRAIKKICDKYRIEDHTFIEGNKEFLLLARSMNLKNPLFLFSNNDDSPFDKAANNQFFGVSIPSNASIQDLEYANSLNIRTMVWSALNYYQNKDILAKKPDIIQTDDPISLLKLTNRFNYESVRP